MNVSEEIEATRQKLCGLLRKRHSLAQGVIEAVARALGSTYGDITGGRRFAGAMRARKAASLALWRIGLSYPEIGKALHQGAHRSALANVASGAELERVSKAFSRAVAAGVAAGLSPGCAPRSGPEKSLRRCREASC